MTENLLTNVSLYLELTFFSFLQRFYLLLLIALVAFNQYFCVTLQKKSMYKRISSLIFFIKPQ